MHNRNLIRETRGISRILMAIVLVAAIAVAFVAGWFGRELLLPAGKGSITVATWGGVDTEAMTVLGKEFYSNTGYTVLIDAFGGTSILGLQKLRNTWPAIYCDVITLTKGSTANAYKEGYTTTFTTAEVPHLADIPEIWWMKNNQSQVYGVAYDFLNYIIAWRTDKIQGNITSIADLYKPEYKGKIAIQDISYDPGWIVLQFALAHGGNESNLEPGKQALKELAQSGNIGAIYNSNAEVQQLLISGDAWIAVCASLDFVKMNEATANVTCTSVFSDAKTLVLGDRISAIEGPQRSVALKFIDLFLSPTESVAYNQPKGLPSSNVNANLTWLQAAGVSSAYLTGSQVAQYGLDPNVDLINPQLDLLTSWWETEILPLV